MKMRIEVLAPFMALVVSGCGGDEQPAEEVADSAVEQDQMPMGGMPGMAGMAGMQNDSLMQQMRARMSAMMANPDGMMTMMPVHRQMAANMLAEMNREMGQMNMEGDTAWNATVDSLRQDLTLLPDMTPEEMTAFMPAHQARMNRLMEMHQSMMGTMPQ